MKFITLTQRYPAGVPIYISPESIFAIAVNKTDHGIMGSVVYTPNPIAFHVVEDAETVYDLINDNK